MSGVVFRYVLERCHGPKSAQAARASHQSCGPRHRLTPASVYRKPATGEWNSLDNARKAPANKASNAPQRVPPPPHCAQYSAGKLAFLGDGIWTLYMRGHHLLPPKHVDAYRSSSDIHVTAEQQASYYDKLVSSGILTLAESQLLTWAQSEQPAVYRARFVGSAAAMEKYRKGTAFEALVGFLHLENPVRLSELMVHILAWVTATDAGCDIHSTVSTPPPS